MAMVMAMDVAIMVTGIKIQTTIIIKITIILALEEIWDLKAMLVSTATNHNLCGKIRIFFVVRDCSVDLIYLNKDIIASSSLLI